MNTLKNNNSNYFQIKKINPIQKPQYNNNINKANTEDNNKTSLSSPIALKYMNIFNKHHIPYFTSLRQYLSSLLYLKWSIKESQYTLIKLNTIINNKKSHLFSVYNDTLLSSIHIEYLKRYYKSKDSINRIKAYVLYYEYYLHFFCRPMFNGYYHNKTMVKHSEKSAELYYNTEMKIESTRNIKGKYRNANTVKSIFTNSIKNDLNEVSNHNCDDNNENNNNEALKTNEPFFASFSNWSFNYNNNNREHNSITQLFTDESLVSRINDHNQKKEAEGSKKESREHLLHKHKHNYDRNKHQEFKTLQFREVLNPKPYIKIKEGNIEIRKEQSPVLLNNIISKDQGKDCLKIIKLKSNKIMKTSLSHKSIHPNIKKQNDINIQIHKYNEKKVKKGINNIRAIITHDSNAKPKLVLSNFTLINNIPKLIPDLFDSSRGRNLLKQLTSSSKDILVTTPPHNHYNTRPKINYIINSAMTSHGKSKSKHKKVFLYKNSNKKANNKIGFELKNKALFNTRNKISIDNHQIIPQLSHTNMLKSLNNKNKDRDKSKDKPYTLQKTLIDKRDIFHEYYYQNEILSYNKKNEIERMMYSNTNTNSINLRRFNSDPFFSLLPSSPVLKKDKALNLNRNSLQRKMNINIK